MIRQRDATRLERGEDGKARERAWPGTQKLGPGLRAMDRRAESGDSAVCAPQNAADTERGALHVSAGRLTGNNG
jgi:hypothetical protein